MLVLVVEDAVTFAHAIEQQLQEQGHETVHSLGIVARDGATKMIDGEKREQPLPPCDVALVDGCLFKEEDGIEMVKMLRARGCTCLAISTSADINDKMVAEGAVAGITKTALVCAMAHHDFQVEDVVGRPCYLRVRAKHMDIRVKEDKDWRRLGDQLIMSVMQAEGVN